MDNLLQREMCQRERFMWSFRGISTPMGVATYNNVRIADALPTQEQLRERMEMLRREMQETKRLMKKSENNSL